MSRKRRRPKAITAKLSDTDARFNVDAVGLTRELMLRHSNASACNARSPAILFLPEQASLQAP